jgi:hypothetical protein
MVMLTIVYLSCVGHPSSRDPMNKPSMAWMVPDKVLAHPSLFPPKQNQVWGAPLLEFVLNKICEVFSQAVSLLTLSLSFYFPFFLSSFKL